MKDFVVPVVITTTGTITIRADDLAKAKEMARKLNDTVGVDIGALDDPDTESECMLDEIYEG